MSKFTKNNMTKSILTIAASVLLAAVLIGGTVAFLKLNTDSVNNTFTGGVPGVDVTETVVTPTPEPENPEPTNTPDPEATMPPNTAAKENVAVENTGNIPVYVRVMLVITWKDKDGNVYGQMPVPDVDYTITGWNPLSGNPSWFYGEDGFYYYNKPLASGATTPVLFESCTPGSDHPAGYYLSVEVITQTIQAAPPEAVQEAWRGVTIGGDGMLNPPPAPEPAPGN